MVRRCSRACPPDGCPVVSPQAALPALGKGSEDAPAGGAVPGATVWLQQLEIKAHPRFAPCTLRFHKGFNAVLGKNGTGKTSLLKLLSDLTSGDFLFPSIPLAAIEPEIDLTATFLTSDQTYLVFSFSSQPAPDMDVPQRASRLEWKLAFEASRGQRTVGITVRADSEAKCSLDGGEPLNTGRRTAEPHALHMGALLDGASLRHSQLQSDEFYQAVREQVSAGFGGLQTTRFDEALETFDAIVKSEARTANPPIRTPGRRLFHTRVVQPMTPASFSAALSESDEDKIRGGLGHVAPLPSVEAALDAEEVVAVPRWNSSSMLGGREIQHYDGWEFRIKFKGLGTVRQDQLSFGQKRLLAFYWYLACIPDGIVIADELTNGFHHAWIEGALREIGDRQAILATQSPLLLDYLEFESAEQVERSFVLCSLETTEKGRRFRLSNPTPEQAQRFMAALQTGHQYVNEILQNLGLW